MNKKIILTENQYKKLKYFILESNFSTIVKNETKIDDFIQIEASNKIYNFKVVNVNNAQGQIYMKNIDKVGLFKDKLYFIDLNSFNNNTVELREATPKQEQESIMNPKNWKKKPVTDVTRIDLYRGSQLVDTTAQGGVESGGQTGDEASTQDGEAGTQDGEGFENMSDEELQFNARQAYKEILNDPNLKKAFYKKPSFWNLFMSELQGKKARGKGIVPALQMLDRYHESKLSGKFIPRGLILFKVKTPVSIKTDEGVWELKSGVQYAARVNQEKIDGNWVFENKQYDFKVVVEKEEQEEDTFRCKILKYYYRKEYKEFESDFVDIIITKQGSNGYNPNEN